MIKIRKNVFETNSSSVHTLTICTADEFKKFQNGEYMITWRGDFIPADEVTDDDEDVYSFDNYGEEFEWYEQEFDSPSGDKMVVFGYYGRDC